MLAMCKFGTHISRLLFLVLCVVWSLQVCAQNQPDLNKSQLANRYFQAKEYAKAAVLYNELYQGTSSSYYLDLYLTCLTESNQLEEAEKEIKRSLRKNKNQANLYVQWAMILEHQNQPEEADAKMREAMDVVQPSRADYTRLANLFLSKQQYQYAEQLYLQAPNKIPDEDFRHELGRVYLYQRKYQQMFEVYLEMIKENPSSLPRMQSAVQSAFRLDVDNSLREELRNELLARMQKEPSVLVYNRLLVWLFLQEKKYAQALRQQLAMDRRTGEEAPMIMELARIAGRNQEYDEALKAYDYIISKGESEPYYLQASLVRMDLVYRHYRYSAKESARPMELAQQFEETFKVIGYNEQTIVLILDYAHLLAFDLHRPDKGVELLQFAEKMPRLEANQLDEIKVELADIYVLTDDLWEAILVYSQVIEANKTNQLGDEVKLKKARLGYFMGEMSWAKAQLDVLKASTSKLIANDAMELSLFIGNNMNLDTTSVPLQLFAQADLLLYRNETEAAEVVLDSLQKQFPFHSLQDDIYYRKATLAEQQGQWREAAGFLQQILEEYPYDLLADDALLGLGDLYRLHLNEPDKAMDCYRQLLENYPGSVHVAQAREQFRLLRGDFKSAPHEGLPTNQSIN